MKRGKLRIVLLFLCLALGTAGGISCLNTPKAYSGPDSARFSSVSAAKWIEKISAKPHSVYDTGMHSAVMEYLATELKKLGLEVETKEFHTNSDNLTITDIHARLEGKSDKAILLVSHYDSGPEWSQDWTPMPGVSYGAADDGYGLATILETLRAIRAQNKPLENTIQVLVTDAEELGCVGAYYETSRNGAEFKDVSLVINMEARGVKGPAVMFETGTDNSAVMDYYFKHARMPFSYSFATDIYHVMPNGTDFTFFVQNGFTGYNFAAIDNLDYYHTERDSYENIDLDSLQHYGDQVLPIVADFAFTPSAQLPSFKSPSGSNFFNVLPGVVIAYNQGLTPIILGFSLLLSIFSIAIARKKKKFRSLTMFSASARMLSGFVAAALVGTVFAYAASLFSHRQFFLTYLPRIPFSGAILSAALIICSLIFIGLLRKPLKRSVAGLEAIAAGTGVNILFSSLACVFLPGCAFLFAIPALLTAVYLLFAAVTENHKAVLPVFALIAVLLPDLFIPLLYMFYLALTLGSAGIIAVFGLFALSSAVPVFRHYLKS